MPPPVKYISEIERRIIKAMYCHYSTPEIKSKTGLTIYRIYAILNSFGVMRSGKEAKEKQRREGKLTINKGDKRPPRNPEWSKNISKGKIASNDLTSKGYCLKPNGYIEITRGPDKGRGQHRVVMESHIGRKLTSREHVHHKDGCRSNNLIENLEIMTINEHMSHHAKENNHRRKRDSKGRYA